MMNLYCSCGKQKEEIVLTQQEWSELAFEAIGKALEADSKFGPYASLHEAYAVLAEEVDELWQIVKQKQYVPLPDAHLKNPDLYPMDLWPMHPGKQPNARKEWQIKGEALDIAAVALRIAADAERMARK